MQGDDGLAGARAAGDLGDAAGRGADRLVLVRLDGGDDVAHPGATAAAQRCHERTLAEYDEVIGCVGDHEVVLGADDPVVATTQHASSQHVLRIDGGGPIERGGSRGAPVDDQRLVVVIAHTEAADVTHLTTVGVLEVETAEHESLMLAFEVETALAGAEHEGVTREESGHLLVADVTRALGAAP